MEFVKPGAGKRVCAFIIDNFILDLIGMAVFGVFLVDFGLLFWIIGITFKDCWNGQSLGKRIVGLQVLGSDGNPAFPMETIKRNVLMVLPILPLVELIVMLRDQENAMRIGDKWAETRVTDLKPQVRNINFVWASVGMVNIMFVVHLLFAGYMMKKHPELMKERVKKYVSSTKENTK